MTRASVLIPSHNRPATLRLAVGSVLRQSVVDLEVLIIGDGVTAEVRSAALALADADPRVRFLDLPKGPHHGETSRHDAILDAHSNAVFYLCDDDLLLPEHVADLLALLESHDLVQSLNGHVLPNKEIRRYPGSLADSRAIASVLRDAPRDNFVSITGTAHRRDFYLDTGLFWETTPPGDWPDRYQWSKLMRLPDFSGATSHRMTALQFPATDPERAGWNPEQSLAELSEWAERIREANIQDQIDRLVSVATEKDLSDWRLTARDYELTMSRLYAAVRELDAQLADHRATVSWRLTRPLRAVRSRFRFRG